MTVDTHDLGRTVAERYELSFHDALLVAAALNGGCTILFSEDMQDGMRIERKLRISNPFRAGS